MDTGNKFSLVKLQCCNYCETNKLESKLHGDDFQKWLDSLGKNFDNRKVDDFVQWLEYQRNVRRILNSATSKTMYVTDSMAEKLKRVNINAAGHKEICVVCSNGQHDVEACSAFINWDINKKWDSEELLSMLRTINGVQQLGCSPWCHSYQKY